MKNNNKTTAVLVLALVLAACTGTADASGGSTTATPSTTAPDQPPGGSGSVIDWDDPAKGAALGDGWVVAACEGDAPLLCVEKDGRTVGVVEAQSSPITSLPAFDPAVDDEANLRALAAEFIESFRVDRAAGCGADYRLLPVPVAPFVIANTPGIVFGFEGRLPDGTQSELNLHYATVVGDSVVSVSANAYDQGGCPGPDGIGDFDSDTLIEFRPYLEAVLHESPLPDVR